VPGARSAAPWRGDPVVGPIAWLALCAACGGMLTVVIRNAWVCDDAYISFRVVDNLLAGHGLRWNVDERVEVYTHPLWLLLHVPFYALSGNIFLTTLALSLACTALAALVTGFTLGAAPLALACVFVLPLALSRSFAVYATSGLENPLSFLLFAVFGWLLVRGADPPRWGVLGLVVALALWNRLDVVFLYAPPLAYLLYARRSQLAWSRLALGLSPLAAWQAFRLLYYGFPFPNTMYAKLEGGIPTSAYLDQGLRYLLELGVSDPSSLLLLLGAPIFALLRLRGLQPGGMERRAAAVAAGCLAYVGYVITVGGDFMSGRFWSLPLFVSAWLLAVELRSARPLPLAALALGLLAARAALPLLEDVHRRFPWRGITDERAFYAATNSIFDASGGLRTGVGDHPWAREGVLLRLQLKARLVEFGAIGMMGYYGGPGVTIIDDNALTDPLLARLPVRSLEPWRIGHLKRAAPPGYLHARRTGSLDQMDPELAAYYRKLRLVTSGPLLDPERLSTIVGFNLGHYDHLRPRRAPYHPEPVPEPPSGARSE